MKITKSHVSSRDPRPKICRCCYGKVVYIKRLSSILRITEHKDNCRMTKRKGMGGRQLMLKQDRPKEKELPINPLTLIKLSPEKFVRKANQYIESCF